MSLTLGSYIEAKEKNFRMKQVLILDYILNSIKWKRFDALNAFQYLNVKFGKVIRKQVVPDNNSCCLICAIGLVN